MLATKGISHRECVNLRAMSQGTDLASSDSEPIRVESRAHPGDDSELPRAVPSACSLSAPAAHLWAWLGIAAVNAVFIAMLKTRASPATRALHHLYDAGQLVAAGLVAAILVAAWRRFAPRGWMWAYAASWLGAFGLAWAFVRPDLTPFAWRVAPDDRTAEALLAAVTVGAAFVPPVAALCGRLLARPVWRWVGVASALAVAAVNNRVLANDYRGVHLLAALGAAVLAAACLGGLRLPTVLTRPPARRADRAGWAVAAIVGVAIVVIPPGASVRAEMFRIDGAVVAPVLASIANLVDRRAARIPPGALAWFRDRRRLPAIPASAPRLLPSDAIVMLLSADSMGASLFTQPRTRRRLRQFDRLRREGVEFALARSPSSRTIYSWTSVFTGRYVSGITWRGINPSGDPAIRFARVLSDAGIPTVNVISCSEVGVPNPQLGEGNLRGGFTEQLVVRPRMGQQYATSTEAMPVLLERLRRHRSGPLFVFAHFMDPHYPYDSAGGTGSKFNRFVAEVGQVDHAIGELRETIASLGLAGRTTFIVTADHGEAFGQHDTPYHTITLYEELLRVPLFVRMPGVTPRQVKRPVTLMDLGPTILDLFGLPTPASFLGQSLVPYLRGANPALTRPIAAEKPSTRALVLGHHKVIVDSQKGSEEIYDLGADPKETRNLVETLGDSGAAELNTLRAFFDAHVAVRGR